jgi:putative spermidine/putrescine transport system ATP-binding protein
MTAASKGLYQFGPPELDREAQRNLRRMTAASKSAAPAADVQVRGVQKRYGASVAVRDVSFEVERGLVLSLLGPSGCGKTTIMRMIAGLVDPSAGDIRIAGQAVMATPVHRRNIGMLFQNYALFPHLTVARNVAFGLEMRKLPKAEVASRTEAALAMVHLTHLAERMPNQLSGGQQQRVGLARALVIEPAVLLLDEPFGALDKKLRENMQLEMRQLQQRLGITTIMVTHDQDEALTLSDRVAVMNNGRIEQIGTPQDVYERPATAFVAGFIGTSNFFQGVVSKADAAGFLLTSDDGLTLAVDGPAPAQNRVTIALRPEAIRVVPAQAAQTGPNHVRLIVDQVVYHGLSTHYHMRRPNGEMLQAVRQNNNGEAPALEIRPGSEVEALWDASRNRPVLADPA